MLGVVSLLVLGAGCDSSPPDPRPRAVEHVLSPDWREGMTWSLEVHGGVRYSKITLSFWGISHFVVESVNEERATVSGQFHPVVFPSTDEPTCSSRLHVERRPWRLVRVELDDAAGARVFTPEAPSNRFGISPCLPPFPRHPHAPGGSTLETRHAQRIALHGEDVVFTTLLDQGVGADTIVTRWRPGWPWWSRQETMDGDGLSRYGRCVDDRNEPGRRQDYLFVERTRLIAIDGEAVPTMRWSIAARESPFFGTKASSQGLPPDGLVEEAP